MNFTLSSEEKILLLSEARETIAAKLERRKPRYTGVLSGDSSVSAFKKAIEEGESALLKPCGAFVTLHSGDKGRKLRGCIGRMAAATPLQTTIRTMAIEAAFGDPRFPPLEASELNLILIEISALSPMELCEDPRSVEIGKHGLYLIYRGRSGVLLPQVPVEQGWDLDEYLEYICIKAGLPPRSYEAPGAELYTFTALVFGEKE